jgi:hypothetical protein
MIAIPTLNSIRFSRHGVNEAATERAFYAGYYQKYQRRDRTGIQFVSNEEATDWQLAAYREDGTRMPYSFARTVYDGLIAGWTVFEFAVDFSLFEEGRYLLELRLGPTLTRFYSGLICVKDEHPYTRLLSYRNSYNDQNVAFGTGIVFHLRLETQLYHSFVPKSEDSIYSDTLGGFRTLSSNPYGNRRLNIGGTSGIPDWLMEIVNQAFSCDTLILDNVEITKAEGASFEAVEVENYNLRSWNIEIGRRENRLIYDETERYRLRYVSPVCQQGGWILDGGRWNDEGVWDDGEYWED